MAVSAMMLTAAYLLLLIPERSWREAADNTSPATKQAFAWNQDAYWNALRPNIRNCRRADARVSSLMSACVLKTWENFCHASIVRKSVLMPLNSANWSGACSRQRRW